MSIKVLFQVVWCFASDFFHWVFSAVLGAPIAFLVWLLLHLVDVVIDVPDFLTYLACTLGYMIGIALYIRANLKTVPQKEAWAVERFGFKLIFRTGLRLFCWIGWIDKVVMKRSLAPIKIDLMKNHEVDLRGDKANPVSVPISAAGWYQIDQRSGDEAIINDAIARSVWDFPKAEERIVAATVNELEPRIQKLKIQQLQGPTMRVSIAREYMNETTAPAIRVGAAVLATGYHLLPEPAMTIGGVKETKEQQEINLTQRKADAKKKALKTEAEGYKDALKELQNTTGLTSTEAKELYGELRTAEAISTKGNADLELRVGKKGK